MTSMGPIIQIREHGEILTVLLNVLQGLAADIVRTDLLWEECLRIKAQVIADGQNPPWAFCRRCCEGPWSSTFQERQGQGQAGALKEAAAVDEARFSCAHTFISLLNIVLRGDEGTDLINSKNVIQRA